MKRLFLTLSLLFFTTALWAPQEPETVIVLAPYADPKNPGRTINGAYERGIALQFAEQLSTALTTFLPQINIVIIGPDENKTQEHKASYTNQLQPTFFCALSFYQESSPQPHVDLYRYTRESDIPLNRAQLALFPSAEAHRLFVTENKQLLSKLSDSLRTNAGLKCDAPQALPITSLRGIAAPACALEIGLPQDYAWQTLVTPLASGIAHALAN